jgi:hypothetical protein
MFQHIISFTTGDVIDQATGTSPNPSFDISACVPTDAEDERRSGYYSEPADVTGAHRIV